MTLTPCRTYAFAQSRCPHATLIFIAAALHSLGCSQGPTLYPVEGKVIYKGQEAAGVTVTFHPKEGDPVKTPRSIGKTGQDGTFKLNTGDRAGAPAGTYLVTMIWSKDVVPENKKGAMNMNMTVDSYDAFEGAYAEMGHSKREVTVKAGDNKLEPFRIE